MEEIIRDWVVSNFGMSALILLALLGLAIYIGGWIAKLKKDLQHMPCDSHSRMIDEQRTRLQDTHAMLHRIDGQLSSLSRVESGLADVTRTLQLFATMTSQSGLTQSHSPISLTEKGRSIADSLGLGDIINKNWDKISALIKDEKNPYDIQMEFITRLILDYEECLDHDSVEKIKMDAFMRGIPLQDFMRMAGIISRDRYFAEHGIDVSEVDRHRS